MEAKFQLVMPNDFDVDALIVASREGRLFLSEGNIPPDELKEEIVSYVHLIENYVKPKYVVHYNDIWKEILRNPRFPIDDFLYKKGNRKGSMNKRKVFTIVRYLNESSKIYSQNSASLAKILENVTKKPSIYTSSSNNPSYALTMDQMFAVDRIISHINNK